MNQLKVFLIELVALWCICGLANGESQQQICVPLGSVHLEPSQPVDCSTDGYYIDYSDRSKFYQCAGGMRYNFKCQPGLYYDPDNRQCEWPRRLECNPTEKPCRNGALIVISSQPNSCSKSDRKYYNNLFDKKAFYQCYEGRRFDYRCPDDLDFDLQNLRCQWPNEMKCYDYISVSN